MIETAPTARLEAQFCHANGRTQMAHCFHQSPLKIAKTFALEDGLGVCVMDSSPGLLAGDDYELIWQLDEGARVFVTTQGFTRIHPSRENPCRLRQKISVGEGALLEYFPEPLMLYQNAALRAECDVKITCGGTLLLSEIVCAGRIERGEVFQFHAYQNRVRVRYDSELIFVNQTGFYPQNFNSRRRGAWGDCTHQGTFLLVAAHADATLLDALRAEFADLSGADLWAGASLLERNGLIVSLLGRRACDLQNLIKKLHKTAHIHLHNLTCSP